VSCEDVARDCLARIAEREPVVHAWAFLDPELVIEQARALDAAPVRGPLHGVPLGIKDIMDTFDMPTQMGSPIYAGHRPLADAACVALARAAGALIVGKTVTAEFAGIAPGPTTNPHNSAHTPGGSSSGSAAAVADGMIPVALGTQTGGSVHRPASYCGIVGFKPTRSTVNRAGVKPAAEFFDTVGILARDLDDVELFFSVLTNGT
jgi:amidase